MSLPRSIATLRLRLRSLFRRGQVEREMDDELRFHLEQQIETNIRHGMSPDEARYSALRAMGGLEQRREESRDTRQVSFVEHAVRDLRFGARSLRRSPAFTVLAVATLALGIGATTAIFSVVRGVLLRPLPYHDPDELVIVEYAGGGTVAAATYLDWRGAARSFEGMGAAEWWNASVAGADNTDERTALRVTADILPMLGVPPLLGRFFREDEAHTGAPPVVVLSYSFWRDRLAADSGAVGRTIELDGQPFTVIGVMPRGFRFAPYWSTMAELWSPLVLDQRAGDRSGASLRVFARLAGGVTLERARADVAHIAARLEQLYPGTNQNVTATSLHARVVGPVHDALLILLAAVGLVLLIACANVAHLQLIRAAARERELALRSALGGTRRRLVQHSLAEVLILAALGALLGTGLAYGGVGFLVALAPPNIPRLDAIRLDGTVLLFTLAMTVIAAAVFGLVPALKVSRLDLVGFLKEGGRGGDSARQGRARGVLVVSEFAMALVLLAGCGLVLRSFMGLLTRDAGFDPNGVLATLVSVRRSQAAERPRREPFFRALLEEARALPGVTSAGAINHLPLHGDDWRFPFAIEGRPPAAPNAGPRAVFRIVMPGYFATMRLPIREGRDFTAADVAASSHLVIINDIMARRHWPGENPIGQRLSVDDPAKHADWFTIIGVAANARTTEWAGPDVEEMYFPYLPAGPDPDPTMTLISFLHPTSMSVVVRTDGDPQALAPAVLHLVSSIDRRVVIPDVITMTQAVAEDLARPRFYLMLMGIFAAVAVLLAAVGVYGVISYSVARRTREIGIRMAIGAGRDRVFTLIVGQGMRLAALGGAIGLVGSLVLTRYLRTLLVGVEPTDPATFAIAVVVLAGVAIAACHIPARRAARVDPLVALRHE